MFHFINPSIPCSLPTAVADQTLASFQTKLYASAHDLPALEWACTVPTTHLFLQLPYLRVLEDTCHQNITFHYAMLHNTQGEPIALACLQLIDIKGSSNLRFKDHDMSSNAVKQHLKQFLIRQVNSLNFRLLVCGNAFVTGEHGFYYQPNAIAPAQAFRWLNQIIDNLIAKEKAEGRAAPALVLVKDFDEHRLPEARALQAWGYKEVVAEPDMVLYLRPEWRSYADYLAAFSSKYRVRAKSYQKKGKAMNRVDFSADDLQHRFAPLHAQYLHMVENADLNLAYAPIDYFVQLKQQLPQQFQVIGYYVGEQPVGFISMLHTPTHTEAHLAGFDETMNREYAIYINILYNIVRYAIEHGSPKVVFGRTAMEIKSTLGAVGIHLNAFIRHRSCPANFLLPHIVNSLRRDNWIPRHPFKDQYSDHSDA